MKIGLLCLQGAFLEHKTMLEGLGASCFEIRQRRDLPDSFDGLVLPGGESTVMGKLLRDLELLEPLKTVIASGLPTFGTCAGLLLLAKRIEDGEKTHLALMDITARRNAYGRQLGSFRAEAEFGGLGKIPMVFIRAPYISQTGEGVQVLAAVNEKMVAARQNNLLVCAFHPELTEDVTVHQYFLQMGKGRG